ncbi:MAG: hypothetical protein EBZ49_01855 [Proteobacteria bacterium]|nr:hypothetical protein [Pseudomonadota bacterium]
MPYFYKIKEKTTGKYYVGCQYSKNSSASNLGKTYFTSSKYIKDRTWEEFEICYVIEREDARAYENRFLKKCFTLLGRDRFLQLMINRNIAPGILNTPESIQKANEKRRISNKIAAYKLLDKGIHNFQTKRHVPTEQQRKDSSDRMKGNVYGSLRVITDEYRQSAAIKSSGNINVRGKQWWNNGKNRKRSTNQPGPDWFRGYKIKQEIQ